MYQTKQTPQETVKAWGRMREYERLKASKRLSFSQTQSITLKLRPSNEPPQQQLPESNLDPC